MFKKEDLKTGMTVLFTNGDRAKVLLGTSNGDIIAGSLETEHTGWFPISRLDDNMSVNSYVIYKIFDMESNKYALSTEEVGKLIWERPELQEEMTLEQVCKELGRNIKIVK